MLISLRNYGVRGNDCAIHGECSLAFNHCFPNVFMDKSDKLVSIITPCYNCAEFVGQAIESVLVQTYQNWEMLIIDDCSTDTSVVEIEKYCKKDGRIKLFTTACNTGAPTEPRNIGIQKARGRYIAFLDSDDVWLREKLEHQIPLFKNPQTAIVYSNYEKITESGKRDSRIIRAPKKLVYKKLLKSNYIGCLTAVYDVSKTDKLFFTDFRHEDYVLWLTILQRGYIA
ncbi:MAG: glycosyltransferase, partial [Bacteroidales bacterium]|nr:glycosyltransferase [Bacteroidales bacterium]